MAQVSGRTGLVQPQSFRFVIGTPISAKQDVHDGRKVGVVAGVTVAVVVPVVQLRRPNKHAERADGQPDIRMNVDCPDATKGDEVRKRGDGKADDVQGQVDEPYGVDGIEWVFAKGGQPVE